MSMLLNHALIRLRALSSRPAAIALLLFAALVTIFFWPGLTNADGSGWPGGQFTITEATENAPPGVEATGTRISVISTTIVLLWLVMWPMIAGSPMRGQVVKGRRSATFLTQAHPALPVSPRARAVAEALAVLAVVMIVRAPALLFDLLGEAQQTFLRGAVPVGPWRPWFVEHSVAGALIMLPFLLLGGRAASSIEAYWIRSILLASAMFGTMKLGWLSTLPLCFMTSLVLSAAVLLSPQSDSRGSMLLRSLARSGPLTRPFRSQSPGSSVTCGYDHYRSPQGSWPLKSSSSSWIRPSVCHIWRSTF